MNWETLGQAMMAIVTVVGGGIAWRLKVRKDQRTDAVDSASAKGEVRNIEAIVIERDKLLLRIDAEDKERQTERMAWQAERDVLISRVIASQGKQLEADSALRQAVIDLRAQRKYRDFLKKLLRKKQVPDSEYEQFDPDARTNLGELDPPP